VVWVGGTAVVGGGGGGVVVVGAGGGATVVVATGAGVVVVGAPFAEVPGDVPRVTVVDGALAGRDGVTVETPGDDAAGATDVVVTVIDAARELVLIAVEVSADTIRRSLASVALRRASVWALSAFWRDTWGAMVVVVVVVVVVVGMVDPTYALASPVPVMTTEETTMVGRTRRRMVERSSVRDVRARLAARR
jgi:hypothetical protein